MLDRLSKSYPNHYGLNHDVELYKYLGNCYKSYDEEIYRDLVDRAKDESKLVISLMCVTDNNCSVEDIPAWMTEEFEIFMLK